MFPFAPAQINNDIRAGLLWLPSCVVLRSSASCGSKFHLLTFLSSGLFFDSSFAFYHKSIRTFGVTYCNYIRTQSAVHELLRTDLVQLAHLNSANLNCDRGREARGGTTRCLKAARGFQPVDGPRRHIRILPQLDQLSLRTKHSKIPF